MKKAHRAKARVVKHFQLTQAADRLLRELSRHTGMTQVAVLEAAIVQYSIDQKPKGEPANDEK